jgi:hypothetical protein
MHDLEAPIVEGHNFATIDLFDVVHAEKVLRCFGQAFGRLPSQGSPLSEDQQAFVAAAANALARDGKVVSVRLALFAEMVKGKPWTLSTLQAVGGLEGIGVHYLEETFASRTANPDHRLYQSAARKVLAAMLPETGTKIKGQMRSQAELQAAAELDEPHDFGKLLRILDGELRLITPTDAEELQPKSPDVSAVKYYQLTHDYLVPSLREWLTRKRRETWRGRAELRLAERASLWEARHENRLLPSWWEWLAIRILTRSEDWTLAQQEMMRQADRYLALRCLLLAVVAGLALAVGWEGLGRVRSQFKLDTLLHAPTENFQPLLMAWQAIGWLNKPLQPPCRGPANGRRAPAATPQPALLPVDEFNSITSLSVTSRHAHRGACYPRLVDQACTGRRPSSVEDS